MTNTQDNTVSIVDPETGTVVATVPVGANPYEVVALENGRAHVTNFLDSTISVIKGDQVIATVPLGKQPSMIGVSADRRMLYTGNSGSGDVSVVDVSEGTQVRRMLAGRRTHGVAVMDSRLYVTNTGENTLSVLDEGSGRTLTTVEVGAAPNGVAVKPAGSKEQ